jgi:LmbE family N-acetylglucosaminyl deacetylase
MARVAVIVSHPDDECLGVGGTIRRHVEAGDSVWVHIENCRDLRDGTRRTQAAVRIAERVGYELSIGASRELSGECRNLDKYITPETIIYTHHPGDLNKDHRAVAEAALVAGRFAQSVRTFETLSSTEWGLTPFEPNLYVAIDLQAKIEALIEYGSEMRAAPHPRSYQSVGALAALRGSTALVGHAEAFHVVRDTWK